jgi:hypothetical protein
MLYKNQISNGYEKTKFSLAKRKRGNDAREISPFGVCSAE